MYSIDKNKRFITDNNGNSIQIGKGLANPTLKEIEFAELICSCLNNTVSEGVNPESVPHMKYALEKIIHRVENLWEDITSGRLKNNHVKYAFIKEAKEAIKISKL